MKKTLNFIFTLTCLLLAGVGLNAQISGTITDDFGDPLIGATIIEKGTSNGTVTDVNGTFSIKPSSYPATLKFAYVGYEDQEITFEAASEKAAIILSQGVNLDEVVISVTPGKPRTILDSPAPIDNINASELIASGKPQIDQMLNYKVPSFNSQNQAISDATAHYDPADLRGLGPSRTLVLVNGKRKNQSAQVYLNRTPGKGEVGIDLKSIPTAAIERVEVLRDGASVRYGSDAIAGVINMVLKKDVKYTTLSTRTGITSEGDGFNFAADLNSSLPVGDGFINFTAGYFKQAITNRAGIVGKDDQGDAPDKADYPAGELDPDYIKDLGFWTRNEAWLEENPTAGMIVGQPEMEKVDLFANMEHPIGDNATFYTFHGFTTRTGKSFAYYRAPYWRRDVADVEHFTTFENHIGYHPTFETSIQDNISAAGARFDVAGIKADASVTYGRNEVGYTVNRSVNRDYLRDHGWSPSTFKPGGYVFSNIVGNLDFSKGFGENVFLGIGLEAKTENFVSKVGDPFSFYKGGSDSFAGIKPEEVVDENRNSKSAYLMLDYDITPSLLIGGAARYEHFSDFGDNFSWKVNGRYKIGENGAVRASYSTGFRAPSLHQRYLINSQYIIVQGSPDPQLQGTLANDNPAVVDLGVPSLFAETSANLTAGLTYKFNRNFSASLDFYNIDVNDRILFSSQIQALKDGDDVDKILKANNVTAVQFFINAGDTNTRGLDFVFNMDNFKAGKGRFGAVLAANFNESSIDAINTPQQLSEGGYDIFDDREKSLITLSRPKSKIILGLHYKTNKFNIGIDNTRFGEVTVTSPNGPEFNQEHSAKIITDLRLGYNISDFISITGNVNNLFNIYPDELNLDTGESANNRFVYSSIVQQQNFLGTNFTIGLNVKFAKFGDDKE